MTIRVTDSFADNDYRRLTVVEEDIELHGVAVATNVLWTHSWGTQGPLTNEVVKLLEAISDWRLKSVQVTP